jgi:hypothetical protein
MFHENARGAQGKKERQERALWGCMLNGGGNVSAWREAGRRDAAGREAGREAGRDAGRNVGRDAGRDAAGRDAGRDMAGRDAGRDAA